MKRFNDILCVVTPAEGARPALERAVTLAENNQARLTVVGCVMDNGRERDEAAARRDPLAAFVEPYRGRVALSSRPLGGCGAEDIIRAVLRDGHDLVIKAAGHPGVLERLVGSEDLHLLRKCPCPVWLTKPGESSNYGCIVAAVDFDPDRPGAEDTPLNRQILELASSLALSDFAAVHLLHAWDVPGEMTVRAWSDHPDEAAAAYAEGGRVAHQGGLDRLTDRLRAWLGTEAYGYLAPGLQLRHGPASLVIPEAVAQLGADLVVMGTLARSGISGLLIGNTAEAILRQLKCSVLAIKPPGFVTPVTLESE